MDKGFWMLKSGGHINEGEAVFDNSSRENKRTHQWLSDAEEPELFPSKKQTIQVPVSKQNPGLSMANTLAWEINSDLQSTQNQFIDRLFSSDENNSVNFSGQNMNQLVAESSDLRKKSIRAEFEDSTSVGLTMSYPLEDTEAYVSCSGIRKVKVNQVKESENSLNAAMEHQDLGMCLNQPYNRETEAAFISMGQAYGKEGENVSFDASLRPLESTFSKGDENAMCSNTISFGGYQDEQFIDSLSRPVSGYDLLYNHSSLQTVETETLSAREIDGSNSGTTVMTTTTAAAQATTKSKPETAAKPKPEPRPSRKEAPNSFPSNVRSLITTGMLDGVPVRYVSVSREELRGMIKGSGYLCGCQSCNYSKALNAYEFECHAGSKTKHPNSHIYFENGKTIYQIVQELRSTPESLFFHAIQTVTGSPINQKAFRIWKESFQAATRELQRIYGKDVLNI